jgi:hypothetical protein
MIRFKRINGWSYKTVDNKFIISNCGKRYWFTAEIDQEATEKFGFEIPVENSKMYHSNISEAQNWVRSYEYKKAI